MRKRLNVVRDIHKIFTRGDSFGAVRFSQYSPYAGDLIAVQLALRECRKFGVSGVQSISVLLAALDVQNKVGFITYEVFRPIYGKSPSAVIVTKLFNKGLLERVPFPETFSHIKRRVKCYKLSDKGHKCLRMFRDTYNELKREQKRAAIRAAETL